ncbi:MAG TPA: 6-pyruvoyl-tetrahydropterin synthase-related protein [Acidobacteriaceae bacterium]|nr:6-pyruvoyl-tetrahydropterin synthase-related protein [Acidobacteriaceae bacterium]
MTERGSRLRRFWWNDGGLFLLLAALLACLPRMMRGVSCGHDFDFHLVNWMEVARAWHEHLFYPHWAESPNWGAGEPRFLFYPPLSWMLGALLSSIVGWQWTAGVFTWLCLAASGFTTQALARAFLPARNATLAGVLATATPYALFVAYERTAYSELAAAALIPLLLLYGLRKSSETDSVITGSLRGAWRIALTLAAIWLTNAPSGVIASYLLVFAALSAAWLQRSWTPALRAMIAAPVALGMAAIYLVPAAWEQRWITVNQALDVGMRVYDSWLFARHAGADMQLHDEILRTASTILLTTALAAALGFFITWRTGKLTLESRTIWLPLALMIALVLLLQFPLSWPLWLLPKMQFLQFPWRWLMVLDAPFAIFLAAATPLAGKRRHSQWLAATAWTAGILLSVGMAQRYFFQPCDAEDSVAGQIAVFHDGPDSGSGIEGTDEYAPVGADNSLVADNLPDACLVTDATRELGETTPGSSPEWYAELGTCDATFNATLWESEHKKFTIHSDDDGYLVLRLRRYPAWRITIDGIETQSLTTREDGLMTLPIHEGPATIDIRWMVTPDQRTGREISAASLAVFVVIVVVGERKRRRAVHLSS